MKFKLGQVLSTPTINHVMAISPAFAEFIAKSINRHQNVDSDVCQEDQEYNEIALTTGGRIFSSYKVSIELSDIIDSDKVWIITEAADSNDV